MRRLDELLQDIPLDELMGNSVEQRPAAQPVSIKDSRPREGKVRLKGHLSFAAAAAAALAVGLSAAFIGSRHTPAGENMSSTRAEPIASEAQEKPNVSADRTSSQKFTEAHRLYLAMLLYMAEHKSEGIGSDAAELYLELDSSGQIQAALEEELGHSFTGRAYFQFSEGRLAYVQWTGSDHDHVELYPKTNGKVSVQELGEKP